MPALRGFAFSGPWSVKCGGSSPTQTVCEGVTRGVWGAKRGAGLEAGVRWGGGGGGFLQQRVWGAVTHQAAPAAVRQAVGVGCQSGWGQLLSVTNAIEAGTWRQGDSGWE